MSALYCNALAIDVWHAVLEHADAHNWTAAELADATGRSKYTIHRALDGKSNADRLRSLELGLRLADAMGLTVEIDIKEAPWVAK